MVNQITIVGRAGRDAEFKETSSGTHIATFSVAVKRRAGAGSETVDWFDVKCFRHNADYAGSYIKSGRLVSVSGKMICEQWTKDGEKRQKWVLEAQDVVGLDKPTVQESTTEVDPFED